MVATYPQFLDKILKQTLHEKKKKLFQISCNFYNYHSLFYRSYLENVKVRCKSCKYLTGRTYNNISP